MKSHKDSSSRVAATANFDLLRAKIEFEASSPCAIVITSATREDGRQVAARGLADSLVEAGYETLLFETSLTNRTLASPQRLTLEEAARLLACETGTGTLSVLNLGNFLLQKVSSQRHLQSVLEELRVRFDYIVIDADYQQSSAIATSIFASADSVLVTVRAGRKETEDDSALAAVLNRIGPRFLGVIALDPSVCAKEPESARVPNPFSARRKDIDVLWRPASASGDR